MKQYRFEKAAYYNGRLIAAGEEVWVDDDTRQEPYMKDIAIEVAAERPDRAAAVVQAAVQEMLQRQERDRAARQATADEAARASRAAQKQIMMRAQAATQAVLSQYEIDAAARLEELAAKRRDSEAAQTEAMTTAQTEAVAAVADIFAKHDAAITAHAEAFAVLSLEHARVEGAHLAAANTRAQDAAKAVLEQFQITTS